MINSFRNSLNLRSVYVGVTIFDDFGVDYLEQ